MHLYKSNSFDPAYNLALEEYLFEHSIEDILLIYRNSDSVIVGKHQNAFGEGNRDFLTMNNIPLHRRFSGGGTVFHDENNLNFSFITSGESTTVIDFKKYALPVVEYLNLTGIKARLSERNDIFFDEKKISGHAAHAKNKRALHHGTLLFDADLENLSASLKPGSIKYESRAVQSVRSKVTNIKPSLPSEFQIEDLIEGLEHHLKQNFGVNKEFEVTREIEQSITELARTKYETWEWNYGYSPPFSFEVDFIVDAKNLCITINVRRGIIEKVTFHERNTFGNDIRNLVGVQYKKNKLMEVLLKSFSEEISKEIITKLI